MIKLFIAQILFKYPKIFSNVATNPKVLEAFLIALSISFSMLLFNSPRGLL